MRDKLRIGQKVLLISLVLSLMWFTFINPAVAENQVLSPQQRHILERLSFGITTSQIEQIKQLGTKAYLQSQLNPQQVAESSFLTSYLAKLDLINQEPIKLRKKVRAYRQKLRNSQLSDRQNGEISRQISKLNNRAANQSLNAHLARAINSNRQLQEVMVDFWFNHFNVYLKKGAIRLWIYDYENQIRTHALGNFRDLLEVTAKHPAMLIYLDNNKNTAPNSPLGKRLKIGLNENYARELMELHTLGIDGGYTQDDVIALARILTGWGVDNTGTKGDRKGFFFYQNRHDQEDKLFLGQKITANGIKEGEQALDILASHPATARFISYKLAQYFVADQPPASLVDKLSQKFLDSQGNIMKLMDTLINSPEFNDPQYYQQKFKTPYQYVVSLVRMGEIEQPDYLRIRGMLEQLSMPLFQCLIPTGYKNTQEAWLNPQAMLQRTSLATAIANGKLNRNDPIQPRQLRRNFGELSQNTKQVIGKSPHRLRSALMMGSPEAMYR